MLRVSKLADYGIVLMCALAVEFQGLKGLKSARALAQAVNIPEATVGKLLKLMVKAGLASSVRGAEGGYALACRPEAMSLRQIIAAVEGEPALTACCVDMNLCAQSSLCDVKDNWQVINGVVLSILDNVSLSEMIRPLERKKVERLKGIPVVFG